MKIVLFLFLLCVTNFSANAAVKTQVVEYKQGDTTLEGFLAYDDAKKGKLPGVIIVHEWTGLGDYVKSRAKQLAEMGYVALAADIYGKGVRAKDHEEAGKLAGMYKSNRTLMRQRAQAALDLLKSNAKVNAEKIAIIGYCFGGTTALELARSGAPVVGAVSFHGGLDTPTPQDAKNIKGKILVLHGGDDKFITEEQIAAFKSEMQQAKVDWQLVMYGGAVHSFTVPTAGNDPSQGMAYNEKADKRSFEELKRFFSEIFR